MNITLQAFSSSGGSYAIEFEDESGVLRVFCHCSAGTMQQMCKHKAALIKGDSKMLYDSAEEPLLKQILSSEAYPALRARFEEYERQLTQVERDIAKLKEREKAIKKNIAYELTHGKPNPKP